MTESDQAVSGELEADDLKLIAILKELSTNEWLRESPMTCEYLVKAATRLAALAPADPVEGEPVGYAMSLKALKKPDKSSLVHHILVTNDRSIAFDIPIYTHPPVEPVAYDLDDVKRMIAPWGNLPPGLVKGTPEYAKIEADWFARQEKDDV